MKLLLWKLISYGILVVPGYNMTVDLEFSKDRSNFFGYVMLLLIMMKKFLKVEKD